MNKLPPVIWTHPEQQPGEILLTNTDSFGWSLLHWETKRRGQTAYDGRGMPQNAPDWFPVFIGEAEVIGHDLRIIRYLHRQEREQSKIAA